MRAAAVRLKWINKKTLGHEERHAPVRRARIFFRSFFFSSSPARDNVAGRRCLHFVFICLSSFRYRYRLLLLLLRIAVRKRSIAIHDSRRGRAPKSKRRKIKSPTDRPPASASTCCEKSPAASSRYTLSASDLAGADTSLIEPSNRTVNTSVGGGHASSSVRKQTVRRSDERLRTSAMAGADNAIGSCARDESARDGGGGGDDARPILRFCEKRNFSIGFQTIL